MLKICFVCLGNICRSPMAEFILKDKLKRENITNVLVDSRATSSEEEDDDIYYKAKEVLLKNNISFSNHYATKLIKQDKEKYDYIFCVDDMNIKRVYDIIGNTDKVYKMLDKDIEDPWYTNNFDKVYKEIDLSCEKILKMIKSNI